MTIFELLTLHFEEETVVLNSVFWVAGWASRLIFRQDIYLKKIYWTTSFRFKVRKADTVRFY